MTKRIEEDLFYSVKEKILFSIVGYCDPTNVDEIVKTFTEHADSLSGLVSAEIKDVRTFLVERSCRYKYMRVFYLTTDKIPKEAFVLDGEWTMSKWIDN